MRDPWTVGAILETYSHISRTERFELELASFFTLINTCVPPRENLAYTNCLQRPVLGFPVTWARTSMYMCFACRGADRPGSHQLHARRNGTCFPPRCTVFPKITEPDERNKVPSFHGRLKYRGIGHALLSSWVKPVEYPKSETHHPILIIRF